MSVKELTQARDEIEEQIKILGQERDEIVEQIEELTTEDEEEDETIEQKGNNNSFIKILMSLMSFVGILLGFIYVIYSKKGGI
jgi:uncharacterized coiled-coil DUF342 family protein